MNEMNIAITGEGIVSAIGLNKQQVLQSLLERRSGIGEMRFLQSTHHELPVGEVDLSNEQIKKLLGIPLSQPMSRTALMGIIAIQQALKDAKLEIADILKKKEKGSPLRITLVSGTTVGGMDLTELCFNDLENANLAFLKQHDCGSCTNVMAAYFGIFAEVTTLSTACSSAANAIMFGARLLETGAADIVIAGGTEALSRFHLNGFNSLMILDHHRCRPFDDTREGLNLGEGAVISMRLAIEMAHLTSQDIQYVNAHGTGTPNNDESESVALKRVFGENMPLVSSTKAFTGHTTSASGSIEAVICILAMQHHFVPANLGWRCQMANGITPTLGVENIHLEHILCNAFGFGGNDTSLVISAHPVEATSERESNEKEIKTLAQVEITSESELENIRKYVKPLEARRLGKLMKSALLASLEALNQAGIEKPDAIITATKYGCLENSERLLEQLKDEGEVMLKPTYFMQSTHNTIGGNIAIKTHCHGYNVTYTQGEQSLDWAMRDAKLLLQHGMAKTVLVGCHEESTPLFNSLLQRMKLKARPAIHSLAIVLSCGE